jgi:hypothetical protein
MAAGSRYAIVIALARIVREHELTLGGRLFLGRFFLGRRGVRGWSGLLHHDGLSGIGILAASAREEQNREDGEGDEQSHHGVLQ